MNKQDYVKELSLFADIDCKIKIAVDGDFYQIKFAQNAVDVVLKVSKDGGPVHETRSGVKKSYSSYGGLLASPNFGNLKKLADGQKALIRAEAPYIIDAIKHLPIVGSLEINELGDAGRENNLLNEIREWLDPRNSVITGNLRALVIDGPAGIGKTHLIRVLAYERAATYGPGAPPPILHVQSRGRKLTTLNDVLAGTLQTLRATLTFDQVPVLVRHGLLQVAIDGFDELADPNGYETAWGSLRDFVEDLDSKGSIILAGRDTFINAHSIRRSVKLLDSDGTVAVHLRPLFPDEAKAWFRSLKWAAPRIEEMETLGLFQGNSYALRPFFLSKISEVAKDGRTFNRFLEAPLTSLISAMLDREAGLASRKVKNVDFSSVYKEVLMEVARDMADSESDSIELSSLDIIAEMVFGRHLEGDDLAIAVSKVGSLSLLEGDARTGMRAFPHTEIMDYFLALAYAELIPSGDYPKALRRGIVGRNFLATFDEALGSLDKDVISSFCLAAQDVLRGRLLDGRGGKNTAALLLAAVDKIDSSGSSFVISAQQIDESVVSGVMPAGLITSVDFSTLDARGADLSLVKFMNCTIGNLIVNRSTKLSLDFPRPSRLSLDEKGVLSEVSKDEISELIDGKIVVPKNSGEGAHYALFERICRAMTKQFWIRSNGDDPAARLVGKDEWRGIKRVLEEEGALKIRRDVPVGGPKSDFYRIERVAEFLDPYASDEDIRRIKDRIFALDS